MIQRKNMFWLTGLFGLAALLALGCIIKFGVNLLLGFFLLFSLTAALWAWRHESQTTPVDADSADGVKEQGSGSPGPSLDLK
jgi:hypothetical protein